MRSELIPRCRVRPLSNFVIVLRDPQPEFSEGGVFLPNVARKPVNTGMVIAVGPGVMRRCGVRDALDLKPGERVVISGQGQIAVPYHEPDFVLMRAPEVIVAGDVEHARQ